MIKRYLAYLNSEFKKLSKLSQISLNLGYLKEGKEDFLFINIVFEIIVKF